MDGISGDETQVRNIWKETVLNELITCGIYSTSHDSDPKGALNDAINWNVQTTIDPLVSSAAQELLQRPRYWHIDGCTGQCLACLIEATVLKNYGNQGLKFLHKFVSGRLSDATLDSNDVQGATTKTACTDSKAS